MTRSFHKFARFLTLGCCAIFASCDQQIESLDPQKRSRVLLGFALSPEPLNNDSRYREILKKNAQSITPDYSLKWRYLEKNHGLRDYAEADKIILWAKEHKMSVRGHTLMWRQGLPDWLMNSKFTKSQSEALVEKHITETIGHFSKLAPGTVDSWDVWNEAFADDGKLFDLPWAKGEAEVEKFIQQAFHWARAADPKVKLFYNDFLLERSTTRTNNIFAFVKRMVDAKVPLDGVGIQFHMYELDKRNYKEIYSNLKRFTDLGLDIEFTEVDFALVKESPRSRRRQARTIAKLYEICDSLPRCRRMTFWGVTDRYSWYDQGNWENYFSPFLWNKNYREKPSFFALKESIYKSSLKGR